MYQKKTVKFGGGIVMMFGIFFIHVTYPLVRLNTRVNTAIYKNLLEDHVIPSINNSGINDTIFMQDNAPCHKAKSVSFNGKNLGKRSWPKTQLTPMTFGKNFKMNGLKYLLTNVENCETGFRCAEVVKNKGLFTKY